MADVGGEVRSNTADEAAESAVHSIVRVVAALVRRPDGQQLVVRKSGTDDFQQPGGKPDGEETARQTLQREIQEELGVTIDVDACVWRGTFRAPAAHEPHAVVEAKVYDIAVDATFMVVPAAEIAEAQWIDPAAPTLRLAPLTADLMNLVSTEPV